MNVRAFNPANWWQLDPLREDGLMHNILLLGRFWHQNNDGEALVLACLSPVLGCMQPELAGGDTYKKTTNVMTCPGVMGRSWRCIFTQEHTRIMQICCRGGRIGDIESKGAHWILENWWGWSASQPNAIRVFCPKILTVNPQKKEILCFVPKAS